MESDYVAPNVFISYSHDDGAHKAWVENLAARLVKNGVEIVLDQWDLALGGDLLSSTHRLEYDIPVSESRTPARCLRILRSYKGGTRRGLVVAAVRKTVPFS